MLATTFGIYPIHSVKIEYRQSLEGTSDEQDFYRMHDEESMQKFQYTGTTIFRNKVVADVGCGCGAFLDYIKGVAKEVVAIEPSVAYRTVMDRKDFRTFPYSADAVKQIGGGYMWQSPLMS